MVFARANDYRNVHRGLATGDMGSLPLARHSDAVGLTDMTENRKRKTMCKVISYAVPEGPPYYANGPMKAISKCEEHSWMADPTAFIEGLCPLGRIEKAVDDGLAKLAAASRSLAEKER